ncbi:unnamed protein product [Euphydryas editha]|nr:unnamed protein product [Euphydryas editha]
MFAAAPAPEPPRGQLAPRCWRTVYLLLDLYANMPDADTITHRCVSTVVRVRRLQLAERGRAHADVRGGAGARAAARPAGAALLAHRLPAARPLRQHARRRHHHAQVRQYSSACAQATAR